MNARYEKSEDKVLITISDLERDGFGKNPLVLGLDCRG